MTTAASGRKPLPELESVLYGRGGRREGREIRFLCPAHDDAHPSARWNPAKETWFCDVCRAGGGRLDLLRCLGIDDAPLGNGNRPGSIAATYPYRDAAGRLLYEVVRLSPKAFRVRRPAAGGGWVWNLHQVGRVLYRLPELLAAAAVGGAVFLVEGEKDADALARLGLAATTSPGGAGKWRPDYAEPLRGAAVVLLPDNDEPGRRHMAEAARSLAPLAASLRVLALPDLPEKGDVSDWLAARSSSTHSADELLGELLELAREAPAWPAASRDPLDNFEGLRCFLAIEPRAVTFLWHPYIPLQKTTLLEGDPGQGKSWITAALAACGSQGGELPGGEPCAPFRSLFLTAEDGLADTVRPRLDALAADPAFIFAYDRPLRLSAAEDIAMLDCLLHALRPRLVILDPIVAFLGASTDLYRANEVRSVLAPLAELAERHDCALLAVRHLNKVKSGRSIYAGQGSIDFTAAARSVLLAGSAPDDPRHRALVHIKSNLAPLGPARGFSIDSGAFAWTGESTLTAADLLAAESRAEARGAEDEARVFLRESLHSGPRNARDVFAAARDAGISARTLKRAKRNEAIVTERQGFGPGGVFSWRLPAQPHRGPNEAIGGRTHIRPPMEASASPPSSEPAPAKDEETSECATQPKKGYMV